MESSTFDRLTRLFGNSTRRRTALAATAATGIAALTAGTAGAQRADDELEAENQNDDRSRRRRRRRRRRNRRNIPAPPVGANIQVATQVCANASDTDPDVVPCNVNCPAGFVASGGGFNVGDFLENLGTVRASQPILSGGRPVGWTVSLEYFNIGQTFNYTVYALCLPG